MSTPSDPPSNETTPTPPEGQHASPPHPQPSPPPAAPAWAPPAFAPVLREPWVNPTRRTQVAAAGVVAALICLGAGIGIGFAISGSDHPYRPHGVVILPGRGFGYGPGMYGKHRPVMPPLPGGTYGSSSAAASPTPSTTG